MLNLRQQADAVELALVNKRGHVKNLKALIEKRRRPQAELDLALLTMPGLEAAYATLRFLEKNEPKLRALLKKAPQDDLLGAG